MRNSPLERVAVLAVSCVATLMTDTCAPARGAVWLRTEPSRVMVFWACSGRASATASAAARRKRAGCCGCRRETGSESEGRGKLQAASSGASAEDAVSGKLSSLKPLLIADAKEI